MARLRFVAAALLALAFSGNSTQTGGPQPATPAGYQTTEPKLATDEPCVIYSLTDIGFDAALGSWIRENVLEIIEPSSWKGQGGTGLIRHYEPKNILIVKQTKTIQKKVEGFLKDLKTSMPKASAAGRKTAPAGVVPADYREPALLRASHPDSESSTYPVPAAVKPPKHLFHFIIRYEGDGIIDDNVVKFMKAQLQGAKSPISVTPAAGAAYIGGAPPVPPALGVPPVCPPAVNVAPSPSYAAPAGAVPYGGSAPSAAPVPAYGSPDPSAEPVPPSPAPKKKKEKKDAPKKTTVTS